MRAEQELVWSYSSRVESFSTGCRVAGRNGASQCMGFIQQFLSRRVACSGAYFFSGIFLHTITVYPVLESILVVTGRQRQETVLAFSCSVITQCSISSALGGGSWLRTCAGAGGGVGTDGFCLAAQPTRNGSNITRQRIFIAINRIVNRLNIAPRASLNL